MTEKEIVTVDNSPAGLMRIGTASGMKLDELKQMFELQKEWEANEYRKDYHEAMAAFKANAPEITKDKKVRYLKTEYSHATLANVTNTINKSLGDHGLSANWQTEQDNGTITVTCTITHKHGHSESTKLSATADDSGSKNSIQAIGSTISYLERYTILALTGLATSDMDDDGNTAGGSPEPEFITKEQVMELSKIIADKNIDLEKLLKHWKVDALTHLYQSDFEVCLRAVNKAKARPKQPVSEEESDTEVF